MPAQPTFRQLGGNGSAATGVFASANLVNNLIIVYFVFSGTTLPVIHDSAGNTYLYGGVKPHETNGNSSTAFYYCLSCKAASAGSNTISFSSGTGSLLGLEYNTPAGCVMKLDASSVVGTGQQAVSGGSSPYSLTQSATTIGFANGLTFATECETGGAVVYSAALPSNFSNVRGNLSGNHGQYWDNVGNALSTGAVTFSCKATSNTNLYTGLIANFYAVSAGVPNSLMLMGAGT